MLVNDQDVHRLVIVTQVSCSPEYSVFFFFFGVELKLLVVNVTYLYSFI